MDEKARIGVGNHRANGASGTMTAARAPHAHRSFLQFNIAGPFLARDAPSLWLLKNQFLQHFLERYFALEIGRAARFEIGIRMRDRADAAGPVDFPPPRLRHASAVLDHHRIICALEIAFHGARRKAGVTRFARFTKPVSSKGELSGTITSKPAPRSPNKNRENYSGGEQKSQRPERIGHRPVDCIPMHPRTMRVLHGD